MTLQSTRQFHTPEVCNADGSTRQSADHAVHQSTECQMSTNACPTTGQLSVRVPPYTELQRKRVANDDSRRWLARNTVRSRGRDGSRRNRLRRRVHQDVHARSNMQVAQLQCAGQRDHHRRVDLAQTTLAVRVVLRSLLKLIFQCARRKRLGRYAAGQWGIVVDIELEQVKERVVDEVNRAVDVLLDTKYELKGAAGFVASRKGNIRELAGGIRYMLAGITEMLSVRLRNESSGQVGAYMVRFKQLTGIFSPTRYPCCRRGSWAAFAAASEA